MEMLGPLMEEAVLLYLLDIDCVAGKGEYGRSGSLPVWTVEANNVFGNEFVYACCNDNVLRRVIQPMNIEFFS